MDFKNLPNLKILPVNKTVVFNSPVEGQEDVLVRTGTISEGSCFFHSILHGTSREYVSLKKKDRMKLVLKLKASMIGKVNIDTWEDVDGGDIIAKSSFKELLYITVQNFSKYLDNNKLDISGRATRKSVKLLVTNNEEYEVYKILFTIIPSEKIISIIDSTFEEYPQLKIKDISTKIVENILIVFKNNPEIQNVHMSKKAYLSNLFEILLKVICKETRKEAFKMYKNGLENTKDTLNSYSVNFIKSRLNINLYFIDGKSRLPIHREYSKNNGENKKTLILICINNKHYEIVGRLLPGNRIQREFDSDDPLIEKINTYLFSPEKINNNYPELEEFLPKSPRRTDILENSSSESEAESDLYYDSSDQESDSD
tara:strand:- start:447 stop:1556 length:1110 start_codon:yes stop_codon:yes gene_type:complete